LAGLPDLNAKIVNKKGQGYKLDLEKRAIMFLEADENGGLRTAN
jgi:hypothetical protein